MAGDCPKNLSDVAEIIMGQSPPGEMVNTEGVGLPLLNGPTEFTSYHPHPVQFTTDARKQAKAGDILFCVRGSTTGRMNWADQDYAIGRGIAAIQPSLPGTAAAVRGIIEVALPALLPAATGSTFPNLSRDQLVGITVPAWSGAELIVISNVVGALDEKIELNRRMAETLEGLARALFRSWFVDFDPVRAKIEGRPTGLPDDLAALFPKSFGDSGFPMGFKREALGSSLVRSVVRGLAPAYADEGILTLNQRCIRGGRIDLTQARRHDPKRLTDNELSDFRQL